MWQNRSFSQDFHFCPKCYFCQFYLNYEMGCLGLLAFWIKIPPHNKTRHCAASTCRSHTAPEMLTQVPAHLGGTSEPAPKEMPVITAISFKIIYKTEEFPVSVSGSNQLFPAEIPGEANCFSLYRTATASAAKPGDYQEPKRGPQVTAAHLATFGFTWGEQGASPARQLSTAGSLLGSLCEDMAGWVSSKPVRPLQ